MPTILRFRGFNIGIYVLDHRPAHVHAKGRGVEASFWVDCQTGAVQLRERKGTTVKEESDLARFISENRAILCKAWEAIHGDAERA
jgi:hypothetical protein